MCSTSTFDTCAPRVFRRRTGRYMIFLSKHVYCRRTFRISEKCVRRGVFERCRDRVDTAFVSMGTTETPTTAFDGVLNFLRSLVWNIYFSAFSFRNRVLDLAHLWNERNRDSRSWKIIRNNRLINHWRSSRRR